MLRSNKGFSLVELMVVVAIIGILAAIAVPNFQRFTAKSKQSEAKANLSAMYSAERAFAAEWNTFVADFRNMGYQPTGRLRYRHGFGAGGVAVPGNYTGGGTAAGATPAAATYNTAGASVCAGTTALPCTEITTPVAPNALAAANTTAATTFSAEANGDIDGDATRDDWTINEQKVLTNVTDDVNG